MLVIAVPNKLRREAVEGGGNYLRAGRSRGGVNFHRTFQPGRALEIEEVVHTCGTHGVPDAFPFTDPCTRTVADVRPAT